MPTPELTRAFRILNLSFSPSIAGSEVEKAYRKLARRLHPDHGGRKEDFQALLAAKTYVIKWIENGYKIVNDDPQPSTSREPPRASRPASNARYFFDDEAKCSDDSSDDDDSDADDSYEPDFVEPLNRDAHRKYYNREFKFNGRSYWPPPAPGAKPTRRSRRLSPEEQKKRHLNVVGQRKRVALEIVNLRMKINESSGAEKQRLSMMLSKRQKLFAKLNKEE